MCVCGVRSRILAADLNENNDNLCSAVTNATNKSALPITEMVGLNVYGKNVASRTLQPSSSLAIGAVSIDSGYFSDYTFHLENENDAAANYLCLKRSPFNLLQVYGVLPGIVYKNYIAAYLGNGLLFFG